MNSVYSALNGQEYRQPGVEVAASGRHCAGGLRWFAVPGLILVAIAGLGPRWGTEQTQRQASDSTVWFVVDVSRSMLVEDAGGSRLASARKLVKSLLPTVEGGRAAVVAFAGEPKLVCPPTENLDFIARLVEELDRSSAPSGGSDLQKALRFASRRSSLKRGNLVVLLSDGGDENQSTQPEPEDDRIPVIAIGLGDLERGGLIPGDQPGTWYRERGRLVESRLNTRRMEEAARRTGGTWIAATAGSSAAADVLRSSLAKRLHAERGESVPAERYRWFLVPGFLLLSIAALRFRGVGMIAALLIAASPADLRAEEGSSIDVRRNDAFLAYRERRWEDAERLFRPLVDDSGKHGLRCLFALGNVLFHRAIDGGERDPSILLAAIAEYRRLLDRMDSSRVEGFTRGDVAYNLELAKRLLPPDQKGNALRPSDRDVKDAKEKQGDPGDDGRPIRSKRKVDPTKSEEKQGGAVDDPLGGIAVDDPGPLTADQAKNQLKAALKRIPRPTSRSGVADRPKPGDY